jgi:hypothetical protein
MKARARNALTRLLVLLLLTVSVALAQEMAPGQDGSAFTQAELDQMMAPIALYPDSLLSQILMAATYPFEVVQAARWSRANPNLNGDEAVRSVEQADWDPSVKSLVAFPEILMMMDDRLDWTQRLGDAFFAQQTQVMDTVQKLRQAAYAAGNLRSTEQIQVDQQGQMVMIEPTYPQTIYVPYYDPNLVYGPWWWPAYPPVFWAPWPGYFVRPGFQVGFAWGVGIPVSRNFFFGAFDWRRHNVRIVNVNNYYYNTVNANRQGNTMRGAPDVWQHDPGHRRAVPYGVASLRQQFGRTSVSPGVRGDFRGYDPSSSGSRGALGNRPDARGGPATRSYQRRGSQAAGGAPGAAVPMVRGSPPVPGSVPGHPMAPPAVVGRPVVEQRPHAFEGVGRGAEVRDYSARGHASTQGMVPGANSIPAPRPAGNVSSPQPTHNSSAPAPSGGSRDSAGTRRR